MRKRLCTTLLVWSIVATTLPAQVPVIDYHQHLFSPEAAALVMGRAGAPGISARDLVALLDSAGIRYALVLSTAYTWGKASRAPVENEYAHVRPRTTGPHSRWRSIPIGCVRSAA